MKGLHKKISIGVLVSGLLIGGVSFPSGSVSYANSKNNKSSLFVDIESVLSELNLKVPDILDIFLKDGFRGILEEDFKNAKLLDVLNGIDNRGKRSDYRSIVGLGKSGGYAVLGFELEGKKYFINGYNKYWNSSLKNFNFKFKDFCNLARDRFDKGKDKFKKQGLEVGSIYKVKIDNKYDFLIFVFDENGNV